MKGWWWGCFGRGFWGEERTCYLEGIESSPAIVRFHAAGGIGRRYKSRPARLERFAAHLVGPAILMYSNLLFSIREGHSFCYRLREFLKWVSLFAQLKQLLMVDQICFGSFPALFPGRVDRLGPVCVYVCVCVCLCVYVCWWAWIIIGADGE